MKTKLIVGLVAIVLFVSYALFATGKMKFAGDAIDYWRLAESLRHGEGYRIDGHFNGKWPPVTATIMAAGMTIFHAEVAGLKLLNAALSIVGLGLMFAVLWHRYERRLAVLAVLLAAVSFPFIYWMVDVSSEPGFFLLSATALWLGAPLLEGKMSTGRAVATGVAIGLTILSRMAGVGLLAGFFLWVVMTRVRGGKMPVAPVLITVVTALVIAGSWLAYSRAESGQTSAGAYSEMAMRDNIYSTGPASKPTLGSLARRVTGTAKGYLFIFSAPDASLRIKAQRLLTPQGLVSVWIMLLATAGFLWHLVKRPGFAEYYGLAYGGLLLLYVWYDIRFVVPVFPLLFYYFAFSVDRILVKVPRVSLAVLVLLILANTAVSAVSKPARRLRSPTYDGPAGELYDAAIWIKQNDPTAVVMCRWSNMVWFWTHLKVVGVPLITDPESQWKNMREAGVTTVIADPDEFSGVTGKFLDPVLTSHSQQVELIKNIGQTRVYKVRSLP